MEVGDLAELAEARLKPATLLFILQHSGVRAALLRDLVKPGIYPRNMAHYTMPCSAITKDSLYRFR